MGSEVVPAAPGSGDRQPGATSPADPQLIRSQLGDGTDIGMFPLKLLGRLSQFGQVKLVVKEGAVLAVAAHAPPHSQPPLPPASAAPMGRKAKNRRRILRALVKRDGNCCFYCHKPMTPEQMTLEHLLSQIIFKGLHQSNLVLAHQGCNELAGHLPIMEKIRLREQAAHKRARLEAVGRDAARRDHAGTWLPQL